MERQKDRKKGQKYRETEKQNRKTKITEDGKTERQKNGKTFCIRSKR